MKLRLSLGACAALTLVAAYGATDVARTVVVENRASEMERAVSALTPDVLLAARITAALKADATTRSAEIRVVVANGRARLTGFVDRAAARLRAAELAQRAGGVIDVENHLILPYRPRVTAAAITGARVLL